MLDTGVGQAEFVVGRTLSSYTVAGIQDGRETITYTVYNEQSAEISGVTLTETLRPGVSFESASVQPVGNGQDLSWSLGTIPAFSRASVTLTVRLPAQVPTQLDGGARATGTLNGAAVSDSAPAVTLRADTVAPELLASTPDANTGDPFVQEAAAELDYDPQAIFDFLYGHVGYESYVGSLRGARGTLWSGAGNSVDVASLGVALMRSSGIPAQYARGTLPTDLDQQLILSMFPQNLQIVGCLEGGIQIADPANDFQLVGETLDHTWFEFDAGGGFQAADPLLAGASIGQAFAAPSTHFAEVPDALRHKVEVTLDAEIASSVSSLFGFNPTTATVLDQTFNTVDLVGKPLSIGNLTSQSKLNALIFSTTTFTYSPYLVINQGDGNIGDDPLIKGTDFQEVLSSFPLASSALTGLFLKITTSSPDVNGFRQSDTVEKTLFDRIGFAARQSGGGGSISLPSTPGPALEGLDIVTLVISSSLQSVRPIQTAFADFGRVQQALGTAIDTIDSATDLAVKSAAFQQASQATWQGLMLSTADLGQRFLYNSDQYADSNGDTILTHSYSGTPRIVAVTNTTGYDPATKQGTDRVQIDILRNDLRSYAAPQQAASAAQVLRFNKGIFDSILEGILLRQYATVDHVVAGSAYDTFMKAVDAGANLVPLNSTKLAQLASLNLSVEAKARIAQAIARGKVVLVPDAMVTIGGKATIAWLESDAASGNSIYVSEDGAHSSFIEFAVDEEFAIVENGELVAIENAEARLAGFTTAEFLVNFNFAAAAEAISTAGGVELIPALLKPEVAAITRVQVMAGVTIAGPAFASYEAGVEAALEIFLRDPPVGSLLFNNGPSGQFDDLGAGGGTGVAAAIVSDPVFSVELGGAFLPTVFRVGIKNLGTTTQTFRLSFADLPAGFTADTSVPEITIPAGQTAEIGICLHPTGGLAAPGTDASFSLAVTSTTDPSVTTTVVKSFALPEVHAITLASDPTSANSTPGAPVSATITLTNVGNVAEDQVTLTTTLPSGLTLTGLAPVSLAVGESKTLTITLTPAASTPLNSLLTATITATFGSSTTPQTQGLRLPVRAVVPGGQAIADASVAAQQLGNDGLVDRLKDLSTALTDLVQDPADAVARGQALANLDSLIGQLVHDPFLAPFADALTRAKTALAGAMTAAAVQAAVHDLGDALDTLADVLSDEAKHRFTIGLTPDRGVILPGSPTTFNVVLQNNGTQATTYHLSVVGLPQGVTASFSQTSVTLQPGQQIGGGGGNPIVLSLSEAGATLVAAHFTVVATPVGAPAITQGTAGELLLRNEAVLVAGVTATPPFTNAGGTVSVGARIQSAVNGPRTVKVSYTVTDPGGHVLFTSAPVSVALSTTSSPTDVDLGSFATTGFADGYDTITVTVADAAGQPITGAVGQGGVLIGLPVTANIATTPTVVPVGTGIVTTTVQVDGRMTFPDPLTLLGAVDTPAPQTSVALLGNFAYASGTGGIDIIDVSDPAHPLLVKTFGQSDVPNGQFGFNIVKVVQGQLVVATQVTLNANQFNLLDYSLADPTNPQLVSNTAIPYRFLSDLLANSTNTAAFVPTNGFNFFPGGTIFDRFGSFVSIDLSNVSNPTVGGALFNNRGTPDGGDTGQSGGVLVDDQLAYVASTTSRGSDVQNGIGRVLIVDVSDPAHMALIRELQIPGTNTILDVAVHGNRALVVGSSGGLQQNFGDISNAGLTGNVTLTILDISDPEDPKVLGSTLVTEAVFPRGEAGGKIDAVDLGNGQFLVSDVSQGGAPIVLLVDLSDPDNPGVAAIPVANAVHGITVSGDTLYATTSAGLSIYKIGQLVTVPVTITVRVPTGTEIPSTFNKPPSRIITGPDFDTIAWDRSFAFGNTHFEFTWQSTVTDIAAGEVRGVTRDATVSFVNQGTPGSFALPDTEVVGVPIVVLTPTSQITAPGGSATYNVRVTNPTDRQMTYTLFEAAGLPSGWSSSYGAFGSFVTVAAGGTVDVPLTIISDPFSPAGDVTITVPVEAVNQVQFPDGTQVITRAKGSASATLTLAGTPIPASEPDAHGVVVQLIPTQAVTGQGQSARYVVRLTNTGSVTDFYPLEVEGLPSDVLATFNVNSGEVPAGASNFREFTLTLTNFHPDPGTFPFTVRATSSFRSGGSGTASGTLTVVKNAVGVGLNPTTGAPGDTFEMTVTNTGTVADTYDLTLAGPGALVATLGVSQVTLAPGESQVIPITTASIDFAVPGTLGLTAIATSRGNPAVNAGASADLTVGTTKGMSTDLAPASKNLPAPGLATFLLFVDNTGNAEDSYTATITGTDGPVSASLIGLDGQPTRSIPIFRLPGLARGAILIQADLATAGQGTVTVQVKSLSDGSLAATKTATVTAAAAVAVQLGVSPRSSRQGQPVTFTATVSPAQGSSGVPTGTVIFKIDGQAQAHVALQSANGIATATFTTSTLSVGNHTVTASYGGDAQFGAGGSEAVTATVEKAATSTTLSASPNSSAPGQPVTLTATVAGDGGAAPTGTVTFREGTTTLGTAKVDASGRATLVVRPSAGSHTFVAIYGGDDRFASDTSNAVVLVVRATPTPTPTPTPVGAGPAVTGLVRFGFHTQPTSLVLTFSTPLDPSRAQDVSNYRIVLVSGRKRRAGLPIGVSQAMYDPSSSTVTLSPSQRLDVHKTYQLTVVGTAPGGLTGIQGQSFNSPGGGLAGANYVGLITRATLAGPARPRAGAAGRGWAQFPRVIGEVSASAVDALSAYGRLTARTVPARHFRRTGAHPAG